MRLVILIGTLDTKGVELAHVRDILRAQGFRTLLVDAGSMGTPAVPADIDRKEVFELGGSSIEEVKRIGDRGFAVARAAEGVAALVRSKNADGIFAIGGSAGTMIGTSAMRAAPFGVPKVMVSTLASGQTRPYLQGSDIVLVPSVADLEGLNRITSTVLSNAAHALMGMIRGREHDFPSHDSKGPVIAATMFGVTTPCVHHARECLEAAGCEVLVFHATGVGGQAMESLIRDGQIDGVLDITTTEVADEIVGGTLSAGPDRLEAAGRAGIPQVVSLGALDMVNFGPRETVPERFNGRCFHVHNPLVTLMRTTAEECATIGRVIGEKLNRAKGPVELLIPMKGISALDARGGSFECPAADESLMNSLEQASRQDRSSFQVIRTPYHINDPQFAELAASRLLEMLKHVPTRT